MKLKQTTFGSIAFFVALPVLFWLMSFQKKETSSLQAAPEKPKTDTLFAAQLTHNKDYTAYPQVDRSIRKFMEEWNLAGVSVAVAKDGELVFAKGYGVTDRKTKQAVQPFHQFRTASISKLITATAILKLCEDGKLNLHDKVFGEKGILNDTIFTNVIQRPEILRMEVHHLLAHTGGWWNRFRTDPMFIPTKIAEAMNTSSPPSFETTMQFMLSQNKFFEPGQLFDYSNFGYSLLGKIIEQKTGIPYEKYVQEAILKPLEIQMHLSKNLVEKRGKYEVIHYDYDDAPKKPSIYNPRDTISRVYGGNNIEAIGAAGGWVASASDLVRLSLAIDENENIPDILSKESIQWMTAQNDDFFGKAFGWRNCNEVRWLRTGSLPGTSAVLIHQADGFTWAFLTSSSTWRAHRFTYNIRRLMKKILLNIPKHQPILAQK